MNPDPSPGGCDTLDRWIAREAVALPPDSPQQFDAAVDRMVTALGDSVELIGFGEALHGGEEILAFRNRLFQRLTAAHGYTAIAVESSYPRSRFANDFVSNRAAMSASYDEVQEAGFSHGFGRLAANRELLEWMRRGNAERRDGAELRFYGFDTPTEMTHTGSPRQLLGFVLDYLAAIDHAAADDRRQRVEPLLGQDSAWENPAAIMESSQSIGLSASAAALRVGTEDLIAELQRRRPELAAASDADRYQQAMHDAALLRWLLAYHAALARPLTTQQRLVESLGLRDAMMAENLAHIVARERGRGKVLAFAHNAHLQRGRAQWQFGPELLVWWPAGAHLEHMLGSSYAVIGSALGVSEPNGIAQPEPGTLEARLTAAPGPVRFVPTRGLATAAIESLPKRSGSTKNGSYFPLDAQSLTDFNALVAFDSVSYTRGAPALP